MAVNRLSLRATANGYVLPQSTCSMAKMETTRGLTYSLARAISEP